MPFPACDALLIDFYGTISAGDRAAVLHTCRHIVNTCGLSIAPEALVDRWGRRFFDVVDASNNAHFQTLYRCEIASLSDVLDGLGADGDPAALIGPLEAYWRDPPIHPDAADFLRRVDIPVCCVSNADDAPLAEAIKKHGLRFDAIVTSESTRSYKPDPVIFRHALDTMGVAADRVVHVGDSLHSDIRGAASVGITTVWIRRDDRILDIGDSHPDFSISSLNDFPTLRPV